MLAQTTQGEYPASIVTALIWVGGIAALLVAVRMVLWPAIRELIKEVVGFRKELTETKQTTQSLADAVKDVATKPDGSPLDNVSPGTLPTLTNISRGGTGDGTRLVDQWNNR